LAAGSRFAVILLPFARVARSPYSACSAPEELMQRPDADRVSRHIGYFTRWKEHDAYTKALDRLLRDPPAGREGVAGLAFLAVLVVLLTIDRQFGPVAIDFQPDITILAAVLAVITRVVGGAEFIGVAAGVN
jgi:hypothetical protein